MMARFAIAVLLLVFAPLYASTIANINFEPHINYEGLIKLQAVLGYLVLAVYLGVTGMRV